MRGNTIRIELPLKRGKVSKTIPLYQYDYGQKLIITGEELPAAYEVHFANEMHGDAVTAIGGDDGVLIPDSVLTSGEPIYLWLYLHEDSTDGETEFQGIIPVIKRARISDQTPTPEEQSAITQAIAALNSAVTVTTAAKNEAIAAQEHIENLSVSAESAAPEAGASVTKTVNAQGEVNLAFAIPRGDKGDTGDQGLQGEPGTPGVDGDDGFSPVVSLTKSGDTTTLSITDANGEQTVEILDGSDGDPTELIDDTAGDGDTDVTWSANKLATLSGTVDGKVDIVASATNGNFAALDSSGNLTDSGHKHSDYLTSHQDITGKADKANPVFTGAVSLGRKANTGNGGTSVALGYNVEASAGYAVALGYQTKATEYYANAEGFMTTASGSGSHAEGHSTIASGTDSHSEGCSTKATSAYSHAEGYYTEAGSQYQHVSGKYNVVDSSGTYAEIIGNGSNSNNKSNARTLDWNGNEELAGDLVIKKGTADEVSVSSLKTEINSKADEPTGTKSAGKVYGLDSNLNPAWVDGGGGSVDPAVIAQAVDEWLDEHPEAVTTVQDGAVTFAKLNDTLQAYLTTYDYYTGWSDPDITVSTGYLKTDGTLADSANYRTTGYIPVSEGDKFDYKLYSTSTACMVFGYNASKVAVSGSGVVGSSTFVTGVYTVPSGVSFIRISTYNPNIGSSYWSSQAKIKKTVYDSDVIQDLFDGIAGESAKLTTASASGTDVGKVPAVKTVTNNKVSEWELKEIPLFNVPGTETTVDIKATGSTGTAQSIWGLTPVKASNYYVKNVSLKVKANVAVTIYLAEKLSNSSIKVIKKVGEIEDHAEDGYYSFTPGKPVRVKIGEFLLATFSAKSVFYQNGSGLADQYLYDTSRQTVEENTTYANDSLYWGSFALCSEIVYASETNGNLTDEVYEVIENVEQIKDEIDDISEVADSLEKHPYVSVYFDNFNSSNTDWVDSDSAWTFDYTNQTVVSTANGDVYAKTNCLILNRKYLADKRLMSFRCKFASDTVLDIGFNNADTTHDGCNKVTIDIGNHQIKMYDMYKNATSSYPLLDTKDISSFTIDTDKWYMVRVERHNLVATVTIQDYITGESVSMNYTFQNGFFFEELYTIAKVSGGNITIKDFDVSIMNEPLIYVVGDSITAYACEVGGWVERFNKDLNNRIVASGRGNDNATSVATLFDTEVKYIKPKVLMWCHGHNGGGVTAQGLASMKELCDGIGCKMYVNHITCMASDNHIARNAIIDENGYRGAKFDVATARDGMPYVVPGDSAIRADSSLYMDGNIHPNLAGNLKMYERLRIDVPELFMQ